MALCCLVLCCIVSYRIGVSCLLVSCRIGVSCRVVSSRIVSCRIELLCFFLSLRTDFMRFFLEANVTKYYPAPWINAKEQETHPVNIWYWVREQNFNIPRSCLEVQLRGVQRGKKSCIQGPLGPTLIAVCNWSSYPVKRSVNTRWGEKSLNCRRILFVYKLIAVCNWSGYPVKISVSTCKGEKFELS